MPVIEVSTLIRAPRERVFDLARSIDAHQESTRDTEERAVAGVTEGLIGMDGEVTWEARHFGVRQRLTVRVTAFDRPKHFQDVMISGPFKSMIHDHEFAEHPAGTLMNDRFEFQSPLGILGKIANWLFLTSYMRRFVVRRDHVLKQLAESNDWSRYLEHTQSAACVLARNEEILMRRMTPLLALAVSFYSFAVHAGSPSKLPPAGYDQSRDPAADLAAAIPQAQRENKRILLEVGGEWCVYCRLLNKVIHEDDRLVKRLEDGFIVVKVNFSDDVKNEAFLSRYPPIPSYPHLFVLETDGTFLLSETPDSFMDKGKYVADKILAFLEKWAPQQGAR